MNKGSEQRKPRLCLARGRYSDNSGYGGQCSRYERGGGSKAINVGQEGVRKGLECHTEGIQLWREQGERWLRELEAFKFGVAAVT